MKSTAGTVIEIDKEKAYVHIGRNTACESCGACHFDENTMNLKVTAVNKANAKVGDRVELSMENVNYFTASIYLYGIPLLAMLTGIFAGLMIFPKIGIEPSDMYSILLGTILCAISYVIIKANSHKFEENTKYMSVITAVLDNELPVVN